MRSLRSSHTRHGPDSTLPLINIVLLLVLAFMIAGTVDTPLPEGFKALQSTRAEPETPSATPTTIVVTQAGEVLLSGDHLNEHDFHALLASTAKQNNRLAIKVDSRAMAATVIKLLNDAEAAGIKHAVVMTIGSER
jgi:biopolymer transport protein ExbD